MSAHDELHADWRVLIKDYRAVQATDVINARVHSALAEHAATERDNARQPWLALAAGVLGAALLALWLIPPSPPAQSADNSAPVRARTPVPVSIPALPSLAGKRPDRSRAAARSPRFPALGTPPRLTRPKSPKET